MKLMSVVLARPGFQERSEEETLQQEGCARRVAWDLAKHIYKLKNSDKAAFYILVEARVMPAPTSKRPEEREFAVDSGVSVHMMSKKDSSSCELDTLRRSRKPCCCTYAYKRGGTSFRSRSEFLRDSAITRRCACCSIAWKTLHRPRIFL